ncbi:MAG: hypothetical protein JXX28_06630 [Deltaproteobacteria bacterium]|nr:hypothetical protein [Deltaproteobacteria bacterium]
MPPRLLRRAFLGAALALAPLTAPWLSEPAQASALAELSENDLTDASTWIVRGEVTRVWVERDAVTGHLWTRSELAVQRVFKGPGDPATLIVDTLGGTLDGETMEVMQAPRWSVGEEVFLFLDQLESGRLSTLGLFLGKFSVRRAPGDTRPYALRWHGRTGERYDARFIPHPPEGRRIYLDELEERVSLRLDTGWDGRDIPGLSRERLQTINTPAWRRR